MPVKIWVQLSRGLEPRDRWNAGTTVQPIWPRRVARGSVTALTFVSNAIVFVRPGERIDGNPSIRQRMSEVTGNGTEVRVA